MRVAARRDRSLRSRADRTCALADPFSDLTKNGSDACFRRDYDAAHLKKNPRQQVTSMTVWIKGDAERSPAG